ncbi:MAG: NAD(P)H-dependent oxidoreductase [Solirubrobacteraceae bacterium]|nr:NAD(P)H-dependent oxidoreductase [Solirubrobacteraceae bacterium]
MPSHPLTLVTVLGSATPPGRLRTAVAGATERAAAQDGVEARLIDLAEHRIAPADGRPPEQLGDDTGAVIDALAAADAVVLATPVYRGSMTGVLKNLLDHVPVEALEGTPVGIVAMGATDHHFLGAERHLRDVLAFFGALTAPVAVYLSSRDFADGRPSEAAAAQLDELAATLLGLARAGLPAPAPRPLAARARG